MKKLKFIKSHDYYPQHIIDIYESDEELTIERDDSPEKKEDINEPVYWITHYVDSLCVNYQHTRKTILQPLKHKIKKIKSPYDQICLNIHLFRKYWIEQDINYYTVNVLFKPIGPNHHIKYGMMTGTRHEYWVKSIRKLKSFGDPFNESY